MGVGGSQETEPYAWPIFRVSKMKSIYCFRLTSFNLTIVQMNYGEKRVETSGEDVEVLFCHFMHFKNKD